MDEPYYPLWLGALPRASSPWSDSEDKMLKERFEAGDNLFTLAKRHGRKEGSIEQRLMRVCGENFESRELETVDIEELRQELAEQRQIYERLQTKLCKAEELRRRRNKAQRPGRWSAYDSPMSTKPRLGTEGSM